VLRVACSSFPFQGLPLGLTLARMRELGFRWADLSVHHDPVWGHLQPEHVRQEPRAAFDALRRAREESGVGVAAINLNSEMFAHAERGHVEAVCALARRAGAPVVSMLAGDRDEVVEVRRLRDFVGVATDHGLVLALETYEHSPYRDPARALALTHVVPGLKLALDTGHLMCTGSGQETWAPLFPHVAHVHVKDAGPSWGEYQVPVGKGQLDVPALIASLRAAGYDGALTVEYIGPRPRDVHKYDVETEIRKMRELLERTLAAAP